MEETEVLEEGKVTLGSCQGNSYKYYQISVPDTTRMVIIRLILRSADPANESSDPDLYVSNATDRATQGNGHSENYVWKSTNIGADKLEIHPNDEHFTVGIYSIGVFAYKPGLNSFLVKFTYSLPEPMTDLPETQTSTISSWDYFKFPVLSAGASRLEISVSPGRGRLALFVSTAVFYPTEREHHWSSVTFPQGYFQDEILRRLSDAQYDEEYQDLDPFEMQMRREGIRRPSDKEIEAHERVVAHKRSFADSRGEEINPGTDFESPLRLCVDTDDWKYSTLKCFLSVKNLGETPFQYTITHREVTETELLPADFKDRFQLFQSIFSERDGSAVSQCERKRLQVLNRSEFTYGEIEFVHMISLLELCKPKPGQVFWDLGCGSGKCLIAAALIFPEFKSVKGVEYLPKLHEMCLSALSDFQAKPGVFPDVQAILGDMLETDWSDADLIFSSSICFPQELIEGILEKSKFLKIGTKFMTLRSFPPNDIFEVKQSLRVKMTWGKTGLYILEKVR